jgi:peptide/nickel transport system substrate-binding protein
MEFTRELNISSAIILHKTRSTLRGMKCLKFLMMFGLLSLCACDLNEQLLANINPSQQDEHATIQLAVAQAPLNLDPRYATDAASERVNRLIYQSLVDFNDAAKPVPSLATWQWLAPNQIIFTLNTERASFHNGSRLTAEDVKATYDSLKTLKNTPHAAEFSQIALIEVLDENRVLFQLKEAEKDIISKMIIGILPKRLIDANHDFSHAPIGSGPLKLVDWHHALDFERVSDHQSIRLIEVKDPTVRVLKLLRGEVDVLLGDLPPEMVKFLQKQKTLTVKTSEGANFFYLGLNCSDPVLKNLKVRQAIAYAIDTQAIINRVMVKGTRPAGAILPPAHFAGNRTLRPYDYQPQLAKQLLKEAGVELPLHLTFKTSTNVQSLRIVTIMQAQMREAGIALNINSLDWGTFFEDVKQGHFQLYALTWVGIKTPEIYTKVFHSQALPPDGFNRGRFKDATIDAMLEKEDWLAATTAIHKALPYIPMWYEGQFIAAQNNISVDLPKEDGNWDFLATIER